jgi:hypothetical protein
MAGGTPSPTRNAPQSLDDLKEALQHDIKVKVAGMPIQRLFYLNVFLSLDNILGIDGGRLLLRVRDRVSNRFLQLMVSCVVNSWLAQSLVFVSNARSLITVVFSQKTSF